MIILRAAYDSADPVKQRTILYNAVVERHTGTLTGLPNMYDQQPRSGLPPVTLAGVIVHRLITSAISPSRPFS